MYVGIYIFKYLYYWQIFSHHIGNWLDLFESAFIHANRDCGDKFNISRLNIIIYTYIYSILDCLGESIEVTYIY